jgi:capsular exopolysaccharide synthesis family protein
MPDRTSFDLSRVLAALRKSWPLILVITLVAAFAGYVVSWRQPDTYQATAKLLFRAQDPVPQIDPNVPPPENPNSPDTIAATNLELAEAEADDAAAEVKRRLRSPLDAGELRSRLTLAPEGQTELITVTAAGDTGREAASIANAFGEVIVDARRREAQRRVERVIQAIDASLAAPNVTPTAAQTLQARKEQLQTERRLQTGDVSIGVPATVPSSPSAPRPMRSALLGGFLGLLIGVGLALWLARYDRRLTDEEIEEIVGAEIVARIPNDSGSALDRRLYLEAFQFLRANLQLRFELRPWDERVFAITSPVPHSGKTAVAVGLAKALASSGFRVVAVDFDLRRPALHDRLGGWMSPGLADAILGTAGHKTLYQETSEPGVSLVAAGVLPPERASSAVVGVEQVSELYDHLRKAGDYVIVDTGPLMIGADSTVAASAVDGLLMVVDASSVTREQLSAAAEQLRGARAPVLGVVLNRTEPMLPRADYRNYYSTTENLAWSRPRRAGEIHPPTGNNAAPPAPPPELQPPARRR